MENVVERLITSHMHNECNEQIKVRTRDNPGAGGAHHVYDVSIPYQSTLRLHFQQGPINISGVNGVTDEALLAILIDRVKCFQRGPFACHENDAILMNLEQAQQAQHDRTSERKSRGVEGTMKI